MNQEHHLEKETLCVLPLNSDMTGINYIALATMKGMTQCILLI